MIGTKDPGKDNFMTLSSFGQITIVVTPEAANPEIMNVDIGCQNRKSTLSNRTNKDETIDQFTARIRGMLRAMMQEEPRVLPAEQVTAKDQKQERSWEEQKAAMKVGKKD